MAALNMRLDAPALLVDINGIEELCGIAAQNGEVRIGALVRHAEADEAKVTRPTSSARPGPVLIGI